VSRSGLLHGSGEACPAAERRKLPTYGYPARLRSRPTVSLAAPAMPSPLRVTRRGAVARAHCGAVVD